MKRIKALHTTEKFYIKLFSMEFDNFVMFNPKKNLQLNINMYLDLEK